MSSRRTELLIYALLTAAVLAVFWQTLGHDFTNYDDVAYVTENSHVRTGLTIPNIEWALAAMHASNWHPITWMSHMLDCTLHGANPRGHHATNLLFHLANTLLLFGLLKRLTGCRWRSAFVAALFAVHPLHVESVAWVAERKDVLSAFFWMLTIWAYVRYTERRDAGRYMLVVLAFTLGLMSKPMLVTLPITLLLLDYWPLGRFGKGISPVTAIREKIPLLMLSAASCAVTFAAQREGSAVGRLDQLPLGERTANAASAYITYIIKMAYPTRLAVFYPHPEGKLPMLCVAGAWMLLAGITFVAVRLRNKPYVLFGWLWYLITLVPVIGLVQVGWQAMADRYTYMPLVGLFIAITWGISESLGDWASRSGRSRSIPLSAVSLAVVVALGVAAWRQAGYWKNSITLFTHALQVTGNNVVAENNLAMALQSEGKTGEAIAHYRTAIRMKPGWEDAHYNLARTFLASGHKDEAIAEFRKALRIYPGDAEALNNLGAALMLKGRVAEAVSLFSEATRLQPDHVRAYMNLGAALSVQGKLPEAAANYRAAVSLDPTIPDAHQNLAITLVRIGDREGAIAEFRAALRLKPNWPDAQNDLAWMLATKPSADQSDYAEAVGLAESACGATHHRELRYLDTLITAYARAGRYADAVQTARQAEELARVTGRTALRKKFAATAQLYGSVNDQQ